MKNINLGQSITILANLGVLAGLVLVAFQIRQNTMLVRAELMSNASDGWIAIDASKQSGSFSNVLAKSIENPEDLTSAEILELDGYLFTYIDQVFRDRQLYELGVFEDPPELIIRNSLRDYFGNEFARAWWAETKWKWPSDVVEIIDTEMEAISSTQDQQYIERIKKRLSN